MCGTNIFISGGNGRNPEHEKCREKRQKILDEINKQELVYRIAIGLVGVIVGTIILNRRIAGGKLDTTAAGISAGGALLLIYNVIVNWHTMKLDFKIMTLGGGLAALIGSSYILTNKQTNLLNKQIV